MTENITNEKINRAVLVGLNAHSLSREENATEETMEELGELLETAGGTCAGVVLQQKDSPDPRTFIGEGKVAEVKELVKATGAEMVIFDNALSPSQQRVLSEELKVAVLDRSALILDIFAKRARTREGRLQVELAQYKYLLPRLIGMWSHLERQEGAIGTRGPGETQLETDRRHIRRKISKLEEELRDVRRVRATQRQRRGSTPWTPPPAPWRFPTPARCSSAIPLALFENCPTTWWRPSRPPWRSYPLPTCCFTSSTPPTPSGGSRPRWWTS